MEYAASRLLPEDVPCGLGFFCLFINGLFFLYRGDVLYKKKDQNGIDKMQQALQVFEILGEYNIKSQYQEHFNKIIERRS